MSQYPPYPPTAYPEAPIDFSYYTPPQANLLAPARRAGILQAIVGSLLLICGVGIGAIPWTLDMGDLIAQSGMAMPQLPPGMSVEQLFRIAYTTIGAAGALFGLALLVLAIFVRRGGAGPAITSIVIEGLVLIFLGVNLVGTVFQMGSQPVAGVFAVIIVLLPIALLGLNVAWLVSAARNASRISAARQQYQAQYHQYQQYQQAYTQAGGYGVGYPPQGYGYAAGQPQPPEQTQFGQYPSAPYGAPATPPPAPAPQPPQDPNRPVEPPSPM